ncbi:MAG: class I SAM-dependent methyltransferase [Candidatus Aquicultor sp.]
MAFFNQRVDYFEKVQNTPWYRKILQEFVDFLEVTPEMSVLDVGCGPGYLTRLLAEKAAAAACVDLAPTMVEKAKELAEREGIENASYLVGSAVALPEKSEAFDLAVATSVIYLVEDPVLAVKEMARVVKKGGRVAMLNPSDTMVYGNVEEFIEEHGVTGFEAESLESWMYAAESNRRFSEQFALNSCMRPVCGIS